MSYFHRTPIHYRFILLTAGVLATLFLFQAYMHYFAYRELKGLEQFNWWREAPVPYLNFFFWALLCPLAYRILQRWPLGRRPWVRTLSIHLLLGLLVASVHEVCTSAIYYTILQSIGEIDLRDSYYWEWVQQSLAPGIFGRFMEYGVLMGVLSALENARLRRTEQEQLIRLAGELQAAQLNALKKQLQPHFLFNTLNTVSALMDENISAARKVLSRLGQLLRVTLDKSGQDHVSLERELDHIGNYLGIEAERFRDRLKVSYDIPAEFMHVPVPSLILQPLVENAIKHGPDALHEQVEIRIRAERRENMLMLHVLDSGKGTKNVHTVLEQGGIGLRNVRDRLLLLHPDKATFRILPTAGRGFHVELGIPIEMSKA